MHRLVGDLTLNRRGITWRGVLIRSLILPNDLAETEKVFKIITEEISIKSYVHVIFQYRPAGRTHQYVELCIYPTREEFDRAIIYQRDLV